MKNQLCIPLIRIKITLETTEKMKRATEHDWGNFTDRKTNIFAQTNYSEINRK